MIFDSDFYYNGVLRWNLGWQTPNYAGAFVATLVCLCWIHPRHKLKLAAILAIEVSLLFLLVKTYSRGATVSLIPALILYLHSVGWGEFIKQWKLWGIRATCLLQMVFFTGYWGRISPSYVSGDASAVNRIDLWMKSLEMIAAAPFVGWGSGESGRAFMNWFQDVDRVEVYSTMVNSYLHIGVEYGLGLLCVVLILLSATILIACNDARGGESAKAAAAASVVSWLASNVFTTLWVSLGLWVVPMLCIGYILCPRRFSKLSFFERMSCSKCSVVMPLVLVALYMFGAHRRGLQGWSAEPDGGTVLLYPNSVDAQKEPHIHVWPDEEVLGPAPGKEIRRLVEGLADDSAVVVHWDHRGFEGLDQVPSGSIAYLFGKHASLLEEDPPVDPFSCIWILHPSAPPPGSRGSEEYGRGFKLVLPEMDVFGLNNAWIEWCGGEIVTLDVSKGCGADIRSIWPEVALEDA